MRHSAHRGEVLFFFWDPDGEAAMISNPRNACFAAALAFAALLAGAPACAQTLRFGLAEDPDVLDPTLARPFVGRIVFAALCDTLVAIDEKLAAVPQLAPFWAWSPCTQGRT